jgi:acyl-coenzyme A thioesterase PaaI-like protein
MSESDATAVAAPVDPIPDGFAPLEFGGPYFRALGPLHGRQQPDGGLVVGLRIAEGHLNIQGFAHGGMLPALADG